MTEPEPTEADIERANRFFRLQAQLEADENDEEDDLALAAEFGRVRSEERLACLKAIHERVGVFTPGYTETQNNIQRGAVEACERVIRARGKP